MRGISLWQPWASAIALGSKTIETRHWPTKHRGPIAIHAAKRRVVSELIYYGSRRDFCGALSRIMGVDLHESLPFGALVAVAELVDCRPSESFTAGELDEVRTRDCVNDVKYRWTERDLGDFSPGRYGWILTDVRSINPVPFRGSQGFFRVPDDLLRGQLRPAGQRQSQMMLPIG